MGFYEDRIQAQLTPIWKRIGGGCHLNRPIRSLVETAGFRITRIETGYAKGPKPMAFFYEGRAHIRDFGTARMRENALALSPTSWPTFGGAVMRPAPRVITNPRAGPAYRAKGRKGRCR